MARVRQRVDAGRPALDELFRRVAVRGDDRPLRLLALARRLEVRDRLLLRRAAEVGDGVLQPADVHVVAVDDVLVGVVEVVVGDVPRRGDVAVAQRQLVAIERREELEQFAGVHELCFSLQVMQTRVHGMAFSRAGAIGSPQSRQIP